MAHYPIDPNAAYPSADGPGGKYGYRLQPGQDSRLPGSQSGTYYHGSTHVFDPGQELTPQGAPEGYRTGHVWASGKPLLAARQAHARQSPGSPGRVYEVRPMADDIEPDPIMPGTSSVRSRAGFKVVRDLGNAEDLLFPPRTRT